VIYERWDIRIANCSETVHHPRRSSPSRLVTHSFAANGESADEFHLTPPLSSICTLVATTSLAASDRPRNFHFLLELLILLHFHLSAAPKGPALQGNLISPPPFHLAPRSRLYHSPVRFAKHIRRQLLPPDSLAYTGTRTLMRHSARNEKRELIALERQFIRASFVNARASPIRSVCISIIRARQQTLRLSPFYLSFSSLSSRLVCIRS